MNRFIGRLSGVFCCLFLSMCSWAIYVRIDRKCLSVRNSDTRERERETDSLIIPFSRSMKSIKRTKTCEAVCQAAWQSHKVPLCCHWPSLPGIRKAARPTVRTLSVNNAPPHSSKHWKPSRSDARLSVSGSTHRGPNEKRKRDWGRKQSVWCVLLEKRSAEESNGNDSKLKES